MIRHAIGAVLFAVVFWTVSARAQPPRNYPCPVQAIVVSGETVYVIDADCVNGKLIANDSDTAAAQREAQHAAEATRQYKAAVDALPPTGLTRDQVWALSLDAAYFQLRRYGVVR